QTKIVKSNGEATDLDYLMHQNRGAWQISDVYLDGTISQVAVQRSEFNSILRREGVDGLVMALNRKADLLWRGVAKSKYRGARALVSREAFYATGSGPNRFGPGVPRSNINTNTMIAPMNGSNRINIHQPVRSMSCSRRTVTAKL